MHTSEFDLIRRLTGADANRITFCDDGFLSRGYLVDGGKLVFKFKKHPAVTYENEIRMLRYLSTLNLAVNLQRVAFCTPDDSYLGLYGVPGQPLEHMMLTDAQKKEIGRQLGRCLKQLHAAQPEYSTVLSLEQELAAWQVRFTAGRPLLAQHFTPTELARLDAFVMVAAPRQLLVLGETPVFSHGDLGEGNILLDDHGRVGIIDFNESGYLEEAADFMDVEDDLLCAAMLDSYGADTVLRQKVSLRRAIRPMFVVGTYATRGAVAMEPHLQRIRDWLRAPKN